MKLAVGLLSSSLALAAFALAGDVPHPLDGLSADEISTAVSVLRDEKKVDDDTRYPHILLDEPPKAAVLAWKKGEELPRRALMIVKQGPRTFEAIVDIGKRKLDSWSEEKGVQPSFLIEEILGVASIVKKSPEWVAAMKKRGFESFDRIFCAPLAAGYYGAKEEESRRLVRTLCFDASVTKNFWGRPIENLVALVDLNTKEVVKVVDEGVVPVPQTPVEYDDKAVKELRKPKPLVVTQPDGPGFALEGNQVSWERWKFHVRSDPRAGLVLSLVRYIDEGRPRSVLYQGALSEIFVPYSDPSIGWYFRTYLDAGEYGVGRSRCRSFPAATAQRTRPTWATSSPTTPGNRRCARKSSASSSGRPATWPGGTTTSSGRPPRAAARATSSSARSPRSATTTTSSIGRSVRTGPSG
jgi:primary-amine oxidase